MDKLYYALPVGSTDNSEIWYMDLARKNLWVLRWPIAVKDMWLYEDSLGASHFCVLVDNIILEFTRAGGVTHQDDDVAWSSRVAFESMVWDESGIILGSIRNQYFKFLFPKGIIQVNATGLTRQGVQQSVGSDTFTVETTPTGYDIYAYDEHEYDEDPGTIDTFGKRVSVLRIKPRGLLNELSWEVISNTSGTDYFLSTVTTRGFALDELVLKTQENIMTRGIYIRTDAYRLKLSMAAKGKKKSREHAMNIGLAKTGSKNHNWKGDDAGYASVHDWVRRQLGRPIICDNCDTTEAPRYDWANLSGEYKRDISDWARLCRMCHTLVDDIYKTRKENIQAKYMRKMIL